MSKVPFHARDREFLAYKRQFVAIFKDVMSKGISNDPHHLAPLEGKLAQLTNRKYAVAVNTCTDSLYFALSVLGIGPGDEVITSCLSFVATASCILRCGATPVFCDISPQDYLLDIESFKRMVGPRTRAIVLPFLYGLVGDYRPIVQFAREKNLFIVEDAAQSLGATRDQVAAGSIGDISCLSFDHSKVISALGAGGALVCDSEEIAIKVRKLRCHGVNAEGNDFELLGENSQMSSLNAAIISFKLTKMKEWEKKRQAVAQAYNQAFKPLNIVPSVDESVGNHIYHKYILHLRSPLNRNKILKQLRDKGVLVHIHYSQLIQQHALFKNHQYFADQCPNGEEAARSVLSLPMHPWLSKKDVKQVIDAVCSILA